MTNEKQAVQDAIDLLESHNKEAPDFRKTQALEHLGCALAALDQTADKVPEGKPIASS